MNRKIVVGVHAKLRRNLPVKGGGENGLGESEAEAKVKGSPEVLKYQEAKAKSGQVKVEL